MMSNTIYKKKSNDHVSFSVLVQCVQMWIIIVITISIRLFMRRRWWCCRRVKTNMFIQIRWITERSKANSALQRLVTCMRTKVNLKAVLSIVDLQEKKNHFKEKHSTKLSTFPQNRQRCALRCRPSLSNDVNSSACVPSSTLILYEEISFEENDVELTGLISSIFDCFLIEDWGLINCSGGLTSWHWSRRTCATKTLR